MKSDHGKIATLIGDIIKDIDVTKEDFLFFLLKNGTNKFTIGLGNILECLKFAENRGDSELPQEWWWKMSEVYPRLETYDDVPKNEE